MSSYGAAAAGTRFAAVLDTCAQSPDLPFHDVLTAEQIDTLATEEGVCFGEGPGCVYSVAVTLWAFLAQMLSKDKSCTAAVARVLVFLVSSGRSACAATTGAYCKARAKLSERFLWRLVFDVAARLEDEAQAAWRWKQRRVLLADGTTVLLADTAANQAVYPQLTAQAPGVGFPIVRLVALLGLASGALVGAALGPYAGKETGETALLRTLFAQLRPGDVLVADRYFCSYWMMVQTQPLGVDVVFRLHQRRKYDFRRGQRLAKGDHVVTWNRPDRPEWLDAASYAALPQQLTVRELRVTIATRGCRVKELILATTLLDPTAYRKDEIADLYHERWHVELDLRSIKSFLGMENLRAKSPAMARKELWMQLLAYNVVRKAQAQAAVLHETSPRALSFAATLQTLHAFRWVLLLVPKNRLLLLGCLFEAVAQHRVGERPDRWEPRKIKRRWKTYGLMKKPRAEERAALA
jgi:hypothetical protein